MKNDIHAYYQEVSEDILSSLTVFWDNMAEMIGGSYRKAKVRKVQSECKRYVELPDRSKKSISTFHLGSRMAIR